MYFSGNLLEKTVDRCHYKAVKKRPQQERFCGESVYSMPYQRGKRVDIMRKCKIMELGKCRFDHLQQKTPTYNIALAKREQRMVFCG